MWKGKEGKGNLVYLYLFALDFPTSDYQVSENPISCFSISVKFGCDSLGEQKLILASKIVPNRFRYNNELLQLYRQQGDTLKCHIIARKILDMPIKVPSPTVSAIKMEAKSILEDL